MTSPQRSSRTPAAVWVGIGVPLAIGLLALWQWHRADANTLLVVLAPFSLLLGAVASVTFLVALLALRRAAAQAMQSRDGLLQAFDAGRRWLPAFMVVQTLLVFAGLSGLIAFEVVREIAQPYHSDATMKLTIFLGLVGLALAWYGAKIVWDTIRFALRKPELSPIQIMGQVVTAAQAPPLWAFVHDVARRTGARLPDSVVVGLNEGFFVTEHPVVLMSGQHVPDGRVLYLPLPYMAFLDRAQVAAVVAHELAHFTGEDTAYGLRFSPIYRELEGSIFAITNEHAEDDDGWRAWVTAPASLFGKWFLQRFDEAVHHWSRERELTADAFSCRVAGTEPAALALLRSAVLHGVIDEALRSNREAPPERREGVLSMVRRLVSERGLADPREHLEDRQAHPLDSHPSLAQRLEALGVAITPARVAQTRDTRDARLLIELGLEAAEPE